MMRKILVLTLALGLLIALGGTVALAAEAKGEGPSTADWLAIGAGFAIGLAAFGGSLGQGRAVAAALEGIARNPQAAGRIQTPMIIGLALIESLVIYAFVIAILLQGKI